MCTARTLAAALAAAAPLLADGADPAIVFSTYLGGSDYDIAYTTSMDAQRNAFVVGYTASTTSFPIVGTETTPGLTFLAKYDAAGNVVFSRTLPLVAGHSPGAVDGRVSVAATS
jgi:hypothetical protein